MWISWSDDPCILSPVRLLIDGKETSVEGMEGRGVWLFEGLALEDVLAFVVWDLFREQTSWHEGALEQGVSYLMEDFGDYVVHLLDETIIGETVLKLKLKLQHGLGLLAKTAPGVVFTSFPCFDADLRKNKNLQILLESWRGGNVECLSKNVESLVRERS